MDLLNMTNRVQIYEFYTNRGNFLFLFFKHKEQNMTIIFKVKVKVIIQTTP